MVFKDGVTVSYIGINKSNAGDDKSHIWNTKSM